MLGRSFRTRLVVGAILWIAAGIAASGFALSALFREQVNELFDEELDGHADELVVLLTFDRGGRPVLERQMSDPRFVPHGSGFYWQIESKGLASGSLSLGDFDLGLDRDPPPAGTQDRRIVAGPSGPLILLRRTIALRGSDAPVYVGIGADQRLLDAVQGRFHRKLATALGIIALGLFAAALAQVTLGLRPLGRVRQAVAAVRSGRADRMPDDLPEEVSPLAADLNALIEANQEMIRRARAQAGNLAHALKTPLAILMDEGARLAAAGRTDQGRLITQQCEHMRRHIDLQLAQARAAATQSIVGVTAKLEPALQSVVSALSRLHSDKTLVFDVKDGGGRTTVACDAEDLDEMLGNLVDNAAKWARTRVRLSTSMAAGNRLRIVVEDDGPGMPEDAREIVFQAGERLDEQTPGSGLGLAIVRDLATLYKGKVWIEESDLGGAAAVLELPIAGAIA